MKETMNHIAECGDLPTIQCNTNNKRQDYISLSQLNVLNRMKNQTAYKHGILNRYLQQQKKEKIQEKKGGKKHRLYEMQKLLKKKIFFVFFTHTI